MNYKKFYVSSVGEFSRNSIMPMIAHRQNRIVGEFFSSLNLENTSSLKDLLETKSNIVYKKFSGVINPPILDRWNWFVVIPQQFNRYANPCNLLTVLVPPISIIKNYLLLIKNNIKKSQLIKKEKYEYQS